jgi:phosphatidylcholine synthase
MYALVLAASGDVRTAFFLMIATTLIDSTDGLLARQVRVWEVVPDFDGSQMDNVIDTLTFLWLPVFIMVNEELLPHPAWLIVPVIAGLYAYGQVNMKTEDSFFLGFPSYWNVIALYLFWLRPDAVWAVAIVVIPGILSFVPTRYLYPSKNRVLWQWSWGLGAVWLVMVVYLLMQERPDRTLVWLSLFYPAYYMIASFWVDMRIRRGEIRARRTLVMPPPDEA